MTLKSSIRNTRSKLGGYVAFTEQQHAVHEGVAYFLTGSRYGLDALAPGESLVFLGKATTKQIHFDGFTVKSSQGDIKVSLYEGPTVTNNGTPVIPRNRNTAYPDASTLQVFDSPTLTDLGVQRFEDYAPITGGGAHIESADPGIEEGFVLDLDADYLLIIEHVGTVTSASIGYKFGWHESEVELKLEV